MNKNTNYNPQQKENQLRAESESWDTTKIETNPPKYPPFSYLESQASVQGE